MEGNLKLLRDKEHNFKDVRRKAVMSGLQAVLLELLHTDDTGQTTYLEFSEAFDIFMGFISCGADFDKKEWRCRFKDYLLHPETGLCCSVLSDQTGFRYVCLRGPDVDLAPLLGRLLSKDDQPCKENVNANTLHFVLTSMSSDWDRMCLKYMLALEHTVEELAILGVKRDTVTYLREHVPTILGAIADSELAAADMVELRNRGVREKIVNRIKETEELVQQNRSRWPDHEIRYLRKNIEFDYKRLESIEKLLDPTDPADKCKVVAMEKRQLDHLIVDNRIGLCKIGDKGRPSMVPTAAELSMAKALDGSSSAHGRRDNPVMFLHHRLKMKSLHSVCNDTLESMGLPPVKSATTVYNRSLPRRANSIQSKRHVGEAYWCTRKPPKTEEKSNESTHHQRAQVSVLKDYFFSEDSEFDRSDIFQRSFDDKAYIRPGTGDAMDRTRNTRILVSSDPKKRKELPIHDWPIAKVYITPSAH